MKIGIVGAGRLGASLAAGLLGAGYPVTFVSKRRMQEAQALASSLGRGVQATTSAETVVEACDLVFLTVPDSAISSTAANLPWRKGQWAAHCSGALGHDTLASAADAGAETGTLHPLQSFPSREPEPERFQGIVCGVEGAGEPGSFLEGVVRALGARPVRLEGVDRALYHAAAVMVNNHAVALAAAATRVWEAAGLPAAEARSALSPLLLAAARNVASRDLAGALTGPIARGDLATVERHLGALMPFPELRELYRLLSGELLRLPLGHEPETFEVLTVLLEPTDRPSG